MWRALFATALAVTAQAGQPISEASSHRSAQIATLAAELEARSEATHASKTRVLYSTGRGGEFAGYAMACLDRIVLQSGPYPAASPALHPGSAVLFSLAIRPDGTVKHVGILSNDGGSALEARLRGAIRRAAPFAPFPVEMAKKYNEVVVTRTVQAAGCAGSSPGCR